MSTFDKRALARLDVNLRGRIILPSGFRFDVSVRDFNSRGARLVSKYFLVLPDRFRLDIFDPSDSRVKRCEARRRWQSHMQIGVTFLSSKVERV